MSQMPEPAIHVRVDPTNPGQFFACCGMLELADRLWGGAEGWFDEYGACFCISSIKTIPNYGVSTFIDNFAKCRLTNTMSDSQLQRRTVLSEIPKRQREATPSLESEKKLLDSLWREAPVLLHEPFNLRLDWFVDEHAGGSTFKTWAGQQSVLDIARAMRAHIEACDWSRNPSEEWLFWATNSDAVPFNFDSNLGGAGSDRDVGFSSEPLKIRVRTRPMVELFAFVGLQRFRPLRVSTENLYRYSLWFEPLVPEVAATAACGILELPGSRTFEFRLLYRTKYLKSFLPAQSIEGKDV